MQIQAFQAALLESLLQRGISRQTAALYADNLLRTLTEDDLREIAQYRQPEDFSALSDSLAEIIRQKEKRSRRTGTPSPAAAPQQSAAPPASVQKVDARFGDGAKTAVFTAAPREEAIHTKVWDAGAAAAAPNTAPTREVWLEEEPERDDAPVRLTPRGKGFFWGLAILTLPLSLAFFTLFFLTFAVCVCAVCLLIGVCFVLVGAQVVAGTAAFLIGLIYGVIQICTVSVGIGIYEIGLGIICAGLALGLGVLTYHFAILTLPYVLRQVVQFFRHFLGQTKPFLNRCREECNKL